MSAPDRTAVEAAARDLGELASAWLTWFDGDQDWDPPVSMPERRSEIADHLRQVSTVLAELERLGPDEQQPAEVTGGGQVQDGAASEAVIRLERWLSARQANVYEGISSTCVIAEPRDRTTAAYTIAESDLRTVLAERDALAARAESATVLPERWRALITERDEARELARVSLDILRNVSDEPMRELFEVDDMDELPGWFTGYGKPSAAPAPDATQEARNEPVAASEPSGGRLEGSHSSATAARLSEPELFADACDCECQPGQPCLCPERDCYCGPCRVCGDNPQRADDNTTEDDRG